MEVDEATYQVLIDTTNRRIDLTKNVEVEIDRRYIDQNNENVESADHDDENNEQEVDRRNLAKNTH